jgi:hypothetical protein
MFAENAAPFQSERFFRAQLLPGSAGERTFGATARFWASLGDAAAFGLAALLAAAFGFGAGALSLASAPPASDLEASALAALAAERAAFTAFACLARRNDTASGAGLLIGEAFASPGSGCAA